MTTFQPTIIGPSPGAQDTPPVAPGPKLTYEIGDLAWVNAGATDRDGNTIKTCGEVVFYFDLPALAQRFYVVKLLGDYIHLVLRDALLMSPTKNDPFPWTKTRHDNATRAELRQMEWRH